MGKRGVLWKNRRFGGKMGVFRGLGLKIGGLVGKWGFTGGYGRKLRFQWKNDGFFEKWGFRGFLVKKSGKIREEPGI